MFSIANKTACILKQNENHLFRDRKETVHCLCFLWCEDHACDWSKHNKHSRHILGVHGNIITAVTPGTLLSFLPTYAGLMVSRKVPDILCT